MELWSRERERVLLGKPVCDRWAKERGPEGQRRNAPSTGKSSNSSSSPRAVLVGFCCSAGGWACVSDCALAASAGLASVEAIAVCVEGYVRVYFPRARLLKTKGGGLLPSVAARCGVRGRVAEGGSPQRIDVGRTCSEGRPGGGERARRGGTRRWMRWWLDVCVYVDGGWAVARRGGGVWLWLWRLDGGWMR